GTVAYIDYDGVLEVTLVWTADTLGEYDIWVDGNNNGEYDGLDILNDVEVSLYPIFVISESLFGTGLVFTTMMSALVFRYKRKR
ncbi:hypothetical protein MCGE09_00574, partial [Thaumarchaeota archaeon SCGC AB-539-E09]